jgi:hypothetical protein
MAIPCFAKEYLRFSNPSGLCILVKKNLSVIGDPIQLTFSDCKGLDALASKGCFGLCVEILGEPVWILNSHFQSDFTEVPCFTLEYSVVREKQERELLDFSAALWKRGDVLFVGDFNQETFQSLQYFDAEKRITFPQTGQHLDHIVCVDPQRSGFECKQVHLCCSMNLSDHIPVFYEFMRRRSR